MDIFLSILRTIIGSIMMFFLIGWIIIRLYYHHITQLEKIVYSITLSVAISVGIGIILGLLEIFGMLSFTITYALVILSAYIIKKVFYKK